ncbi:MAG: hypothetical protein EXR70_01275 [Deltaproteobacteria bacterium]|nr:hypothetical protein [Deltaproteobacteria bacterium]
MAADGITELGRFERCRNCGAELAPGKEQCPACGTRSLPFGKTSLSAATSSSLGLKITRGIIVLLLLVVANLYLPYVTPYLRLVWPIWYAPLVGEAMSRLESDPRAVATMGVPIRHGWFVRGFLQNDDDETGVARFRVTVRGSKGPATLEAWLGRVEDTWVFSKLQLAVAGGTSINLLDAVNDPPREKVATGSRVYLVPVGPLPDLALNQLPEFYKANFGLEVVVLAPIPIASQVRDLKRKQLIAEELVTLVQRRLPHLAKDTHSFLIAVTAEDMYFRERNWNFTPTYWDGVRGGAVSSARFVADGPNEAPSLVQSRVRKMISRVIGMLLYKMPRSDDPSSVLSNIYSMAFSADLMSDNIDDLGSRAVIDNFKSSHWLPSLPPTISADKKDFDAKGVDGSYPCLLAKHDRDPSSRTTAFTVSVTKCLAASLLIDTDVNELEIDLRTGLLRHRETDLFIPGTQSLSVTRCYRLWDDKVRTFGYNTTLAWDMFPSGNRNPYSDVGLNLCGGSRVEFDRISDGSGYMDALFEHRQTASPFLRARFGWAGNGWNLDRADGVHMFFPESYNAKRGVDGALVEFKNAKGESVTIERDKARNLTRLSTVNGQFLKFDHDSRNRMIRARDHEQRTVDYTYDIAGRLVQVKSPASTRRYTYEGTYLLSVRNDGEQLFRSSYTRGRIGELSLHGTEDYKFRYDYDPRDNYTVLRTHLTLPDGTVKAFDIKPK